MIVDLSVGLNTDEVDQLEWETVDAVIHTATTAEELAKQLDNLKLETPSSAFDERVIICGTIKTVLASISIR